MTPPLAFIPSPSSSTLGSLGPITLRWYGLLIALGVLVAGWIAQRELVRRGIDAERVYTLATWCIPGGILGARIYHIVTDWGRFSHHLSRLPQIWQGGLGLPGVIMGGAVGAAIGARRAGIPVLVAFDALAPGLIAAQALGRWGNYFNQELFGSPTRLPWGLKIAPTHRPVGYEQFATFHPTFLYESIWDVLVFCMLMVLISRWWRRLVPGAIFAAYLAAYSFGRFWIEGLRIDTAQYIFGVRFNQVLFGAVFVAAVVWFGLAVRRSRTGSHPPPPRVATGRAGLDS